MKILKILKTVTFTRMDHTRKKGIDDLDKQCHVY